MSSSVFLHQQLRMLRSTIEINRHLCHYKFAYTYASLLKASGLCIGEVDQDVLADRYANSEYLLVSAEGSGSSS